MAGSPPIPGASGGSLQATAAVRKIWNHDMNRDWREHHTNRHLACKTSVRWMDDGPVQVEFFHPFFAEGMRGKDGEVENSRGYVVSNASDIEVPGWPTLGISNPDDGKWVDFVKTSLHECASHECCGNLQRHPGSFAPTRLLEIILDSEKIKLIETAKRPNITRYATLSHCWGPSGSGKHFQTTYSNYDAMKKEILYKDLPATFQDAVTVCRTLNVRYLWIDSLCIIQQDKSDWEIESAKMCDYYGNAYLTISGTCSSRSSIPFLRAPKKYPCETLHFQLGGEVQVRRLGRDDNWQNPTQPRKNLASPGPIHATKPILSRAWVFQENSLSTRVIHFTEEAVLFECKDSLRSASKLLTRGTQNLFSRIQSWDRIKDDWDRVLDADPYGMWRRCISSYFPLRLTCEDDRLPGLSGLAESKIRQIISLQKDKVKIRADEATHEPPLYLAGLWKASLAQDLCWRLAGEDGIVPSKYVAPSWSWAALQGEVIHFASETKDFLPALEFESNLLILENSESIFGKVTQGSYIVVSAPMKAMNLIYTHSSLTLPEKTHFLAPGIRGIDEDEFFVSIDVAAAGTELLGRTEYTEMWNTWTIDRLVKPVFCMLAGEALGQLHGLILEVVEVEEKDQKGVAEIVEHSCFKRIGYFRTRRIMYAGKWGDPIRVEDQEKVQRCRDAFMAGGKKAVRLY